MPSFSQLMWNCPETQPDRDQASIEMPIDTCEERLLAKVFPLSAPRGSGCEGPDPVDGQLWAKIQAALFELEELGETERV